MRVSSDGWASFVHHLLTVDGAIFSCSDSHLLVRCFSTRTTLIRFIFFFIITLFGILSAKIRNNWEFHLNYLVVRNKMHTFALIIPKQILILALRITVKRECMKKIILALALGICSTMYVNAQVTAEEPEFSEETLLLTSDSTGVILKRENGYVKAKAGASLYLTGIGKIKSRLTIDGAKSINATKAQKTARLILKAKDNDTDPNSFINIFKFQIYNNKERRYQLSEVGTLSAAKTTNLASVEYKAKKYGESSYLIKLEDLEPGEYGIIIGDPNNANTKNGMKVTTFTVE